MRSITNNVVPIKQEIYIENLKCGGCVATIEKGIVSIDGVTNVEILVDESLVSFDSDEESVVRVREKLSKLGYPEVGDKNTIVHKAKSFVSFAAGRMSK